MVITNIVDGQFDTELASSILTDKDIQEVLLTNIIEVMKEKGYRGLDVDFEYLGKDNKDLYLEFLLYIKDRFKEENLDYTLSVALPPKSSNDQVGTLYEGHDYS